MAGDACRVDFHEDQAQNVAQWRLMGSCSNEQRESLAISAESILELLKQGMGIELYGIVLKGNLDLNQLPEMAIESGQISSALVRERFEREGVTSVRVIKGPFIMRDSRVRGTIATNLAANGYLLVQGPVSLAGSQIEESVDFSQTVFDGPVDVSEAVIAYEAFFIRAVFNGQATFERVNFGTHTRFHKAIFSERVSFAGSRFKGLAEFLEVTFENEAGFARSRYDMGTGFSGSLFKGMLDFSEATFEHEVYFRFTQFFGEANFKAAVFHETADFTEATFHGRPDFTSASFDVPPIFSGGSAPQLIAGSHGQPRLNVSIFLWGVALAFVILAVLLSKRTKSRGHG